MTIRRVTTFIGFLIITAAPVTVFTGKASWWDSFAGILAGILLIFVREPDITTLIKAYINNRKA